MTTINLNQSLFSQLREQYRADLEKDIVYPLTYILFSPHLNSNIQYRINHKISLKDFVYALKAYLKIAGTITQPLSNESVLYKDDSLCVVPFKKPDNIPFTTITSDDEESNASE
jgi:hypothetical protein